MAFDGTVQGGDVDAPDASVPPLVKRPHGERGRKGRGGFVLQEALKLANEEEYKSLQVCYI